MYLPEDQMNLPEDASPAAKKLYTILANSDTPKTKDELKAEYASWAPGTERYKAVATASNLLVKGIAKKEKDGEQEVYTLVKGSDEIGPDKEADAKEEYADKTDANAEEERMIAILEQHDRRLPEDELFNLYLKGQTPDSEAPTPEEDIEAALKELTDAGKVSAEEDGYQLKRES